MIRRILLSAAAIFLFTQVPFAQPANAGEPETPKAESEEAKTPKAGGKKVEAPKTKTPAIDRAKVLELIEQLDANDMKVRDKASASLKDIGPAAGDLVTRAMKKKDASVELKHRCDDILTTYRLAMLPQLLKKASLKGSAKLGNFTRNKKKAVYMGADSMRGTYTFSPYYMLLKELAFMEEILPSSSAVATLKSKDMTWTLLLPFGEWPEKAKKPRKAYIEARTKKIVETGQKHERTLGRLYIKKLRAAGVDIEMPTPWKTKADEDKKERVGGRS